VKDVIDLYRFGQAELAAYTILLQDLKRSNLFIIELLARPMGLNILCRKPHLITNLKRYVPPVFVCL